MLSLNITVVRSIVFITSRHMYLARRSWVTSSPTFFILKDTKIYISISNGSNIMSNIEATVDNSLGFGTTLQIPDVNPNDS